MYVTLVFTTHGLASDFYLKNRFKELRYVISSPWMGTGRLDSKAWHMTLTTALRDSYESRLSERYNFHCI